MMSKTVVMFRHTAGTSFQASLNMEETLSRLKQTFRSASPFQKKQAYPMECGVSATYPSTNGGAPNGIMTDVRSERSPAKSGLHVNFSEKGEVKERREKFLTAKYGSHQMSLIRKRLAVEMWLYDELQKLYEPSVSAFIFFYFSHLHIYILETGRVSDAYSVKPVRKSSS
jgi:protein phosphatase 1 regulatory subunit 14B